WWRRRHSPATRCRCRVSRLLPEHGINLSTEGKSRPRRCGCAYQQFLARRDSLTNTKASRTNRNCRIADGDGHGSSGVGTAEGEEPRHQARNDAATSYRPNPIGEAGASRGKRVSIAMSTVGQHEIRTQRSVIDFFKKALEYRYLG